MENPKKTNSFLIVIIVLLVIAIGVGVVLTVKMSNKPAEPAATAAPAAPAETQKPALTVDESAGDYQAPAAEEILEAPGVAIPGWGSLTIPPRTTELANMVDFYNPAANEGNYYLTFELLVPVQKEGEETAVEYESVYASQLVPPGKHIQSITLTHGLEAGEYDAIIHVQPYTMDGSLTPTNNADMKTKLIVK